MSARDRLGLVGALALAANAGMGQSAELLPRRGFSREKGPAYTPPKKPRTSPRVHGNRWWRRQMAKVAARGDS